MFWTRPAASVARIPAAVTNTGRAEFPRRTRMAWVADVPGLSGAHDLVHGDRGAGLRLAGLSPQWVSALRRLSAAVHLLVLFALAQRGAFAPDGIIATLVPVTTVVWILAVAATCHDHGGPPPAPASKLPGKFMAHCGNASPADGTVGPGSPPGRPSRGSCGASSHGCAWHRRAVRRQRPGREQSCGGRPARGALGHRYHRDRPQRAGEPGGRWPVRARRPDPVRRHCTQPGARRSGACWWGIPAE